MPSNSHLKVGHNVRRPNWIELEIEDFSTEAFPQDGWRDDNEEYPDSSDLEQIRDVPFCLTIGHFLAESMGKAPSMRPHPRRGATLKGAADIPSAPSPTAATAYSKALLKTIFSVNRLQRSQSLSSVLVQSPGETYGNVACSDYEKDDSRETTPRHTFSTDFPATHAMVSLLPDSIHMSILGPQWRSSLLVTSTTARAAMLLIWSECSLKVAAVPLVGLEDYDPWNLTQVIANKIQKKFNAFLGDKSRDIPPKLLHWKMSCFLSDNLNEWQKFLEKQLIVRSSPQESMLSAGLKNQSITHDIEGILKKLGMSFKPTMEPFDLFLDWKSQKTEPPIEKGNDQQAPDETKLSDKGPEQENACPVCLEELMEKSDVCRLISCGHAMCSECCITYLENAGASGKGHIECPAFQCSETIGVMDASHIMFDTTRSTTVQKKTLEKLFRFEMQQHVLGRSGKFCTSPNCGSVVLLQSKRCANQNGLPGWNTAICRCGQIYCNECPNLGPAHPGLSCRDFSRIRKKLDEGKLEEDAASESWLMKYSRPCPKCSFGIERFEGCNHVRCQKCSYYFCWQCGGFGNDCGAFFCRNTNKSSHDALSFDEEKMEHLDCFTMTCDDYRKSLKLLGQIRSTIARTEESSSSFRDVVHLKKSIQLVQVLNWVYLIHIAAMMGTKCLSPNLPFKEESKKAKAMICHALASCTGRITSRKLSKMEISKCTMGQTSCLEYNFDCDEMDLMLAVGKALDHGLHHVFKANLSPTSPKIFAIPEQSMEDDTERLNQKKSKVKCGWKGKKKSCGGGRMRQPKWKGKQKASARRAIALGHPF